LYRGGDFVTILFEVILVKARWIPFPIISIFFIPLFSTFTNPNAPQQHTSLLVETFPRIPDSLALGAAILVFALLTMLPMFISTKPYKIQYF
jgi:hypothetical protein